MTVRARRAPVRQPSSGVALFPARGRTVDQERKAAEALALVLPLWRFAEMVESCKLGKDLTYSRCDDWLILARDAVGQLYAVNTEMWPEWLHCPAGADQERGAVERYMLPVARARWDRLMFRKCEEA